MQRCEIELDLPPARAEEALVRATEEWNGDWRRDGEGGRLALPVLFGLRRGIAVGRVEIVRLGDERSRLVWTLEQSHLELHKSAVAVLLFAAVPLAITAAWPFHPPLLALVPFAAVAGLAAWWLVASRLRSRGPHEFFEAIRGLRSQGIAAASDPLG
jgi:hypothetical protein